MRESLFEATASFFDQLCDVDNLREGFTAAKRNRGSHGIDKASIPDFELNLDKELSQLKKELESWTYTPSGSPVRTMVKVAVSPVSLTGV